MLFIFILMLSSKSTGKAKVFLLLRPSIRVINSNICFICVLVAPAQGPTQTGTLLDISEPSPVSTGISLDFPSGPTLVTEETIKK